MGSKARSDEVLKIADLVAMAGTASASGKSFHSVLAAQKSAMDNVGQDPWETVPMILVKHRWMKGRNVVAGSTVISFQMDGIAHVKDHGNARVDVEQYVRTSRGVAEILPDPVKSVTPEAVPVQKAESKQVSQEPPSAEQPIVATDAGSSDDVAQEPKKKTPPKARKP